MSCELIFTRYALFFAGHFSFPSIGSIKMQATQHCGEAAGPGYNFVVSNQINNNLLSLLAMKNPVNSLRLGSYVLAALMLLVFSCKDDKEPVPQGNLLFYTNYTPEKYDRIDVIVDGKVMGSISETAAVRPECNAAGSASVVSLMLPVGTYAVSGKRYKGGEQVGNWKASSASVTVEECKRIRFVE